MDDYLDQFMEDHINGGYGTSWIGWRKESEEYRNLDFDEPWESVGSAGARGLRASG